IPRNPLSPQGGTDAPVTICQDPPCPRTNGDPGVPLGVLGSPSRTIGMSGGTDAPVVIGTNGGTDAPVVIGTNGGTDAPVIICQNPPCPTTNGDPDVPLGALVSTSDSSLYNFSNPACASQILVLGSPRGRTLLAVEFSGGGRIAPAGRVTVPAGLERTEAIAAAGSTFLEAACR
ncbi:MAG TPA: hypothetical protein VFB95_06660, partial [Candidatus Cryosericum sp.]|nr:hypothetical protein [Candidatus Cryosericum sp.]